jgi:hypothetical protein
MVPEGVDYNVTFRRSVSGFTSQVPSMFEGWAALLTVSGATTVDVTLPAAAPTRFLVKDAAGNPLPGARVYLSGANYGVDPPTVVTSSPSVSAGLMMGSSGSQVIADDSGYATMWLWPFPNVVTAYVAYQSSQGFTVNSTVDFTPGTAQTVDVVFARFAEIPSEGGNAGDVIISLETDDTFTDVDIDPLNSSLPANAVDLVGQVSFTVTGVAIGATAEVSITIPDGADVSRVYKVDDTALVDITSTVDVSDRTVALTIQDGGPGDEDGQANGTIVDPLVIAGSQPPPQSGGGGGGGGGDGGGGGGGGGGVAPVVPSPSPTASPSPSPSMPTDPMPIVRVPGPGEAVVLVGGLPDPALRVGTVPDGTGVAISGSGFTVSLGSSAEVPVDPRGSLVLLAGGVVSLSAAGFAPGNPVVGYLNPPTASSSTFFARAASQALGQTTRLGQVDADDSGAISGALPLPASLAAGDHALQLIGLTARGELLVLTVGIVVTAQSPPTKAIRVTAVRGKGKASSRVLVRGTTIGLAGASVTAWVRVAGGRAYQPWGKRAVIGHDGKFLWSAISAKAVYIYFTADGGVRSRAVHVPAMRRH